MNENIVPFELLPVMQPGSIDLSGDRCTPIIYDEVVQTPDSNLVEIIEKFASRGVTVHAQFVESMVDEGYDSPDVITSGNQYVDDLIIQCGWDKENAITIVVSGNPRYYDIAVDGVQDTLDRSKPEIYDRARSTFVSGLREGDADTYQQDAAKALNRLYDEQFPERIKEQPVTLPAPQTEQTPQSAENGFDIPVVPLVEVGLAGAIIASSVARLVRRRSLMKIETTFSKTIAVDTKLVTSAYNNAASDASLTKILPEDDATKLRELEAKLIDGYQAWQNSSVLQRERFRTNKRRVWPSKLQAQTITEEYDSLTRQYIEEVKDYNKELELVQRKSIELNDLAIKTDNMIASLREALDKLASSEEQKNVYDVTILNERLATAQINVDDANKLRENHYVERPYDLYKSSMIAIQEIHDFADALPRFHQEIIEETKQKNTDQVSREDTLNKTVDVVAELHEHFDKSCWLNTEEELAEIQQIFADINQLSADIANPATQFDVAKLIGDRERLDTISDLTENFEKTNSDILSHAKRLQNLKQNLPEMIESHAAKQAENEAFCVRYAEDIEDSTENEIKEALTVVTALRGKLATAKPAYLQVEKELEKAQLNLASSFTKAQAERNEMISLRADIESLAISVQSAIREAVSYESSHADVDSQTESDIRNLDLPEAPRERHRAALRAAKKLYENALTEARNALSDAKADVRREEEARERERQRLLEIQRQAEAARQAAARAASMSISSSSRPGGSGHNSGTF